jgi:hypothetical protein
LAYTFAYTFASLCLGCEPKARVAIDVTMVRGKFNKNPTKLFLLDGCIKP